MLPHPSPPANRGQNGYQGGAPAFRPVCSILRQPVPPSRVKRRKRGMVASLVEYIVIATSMEKENLGTQQAGGKQGRKDK